MIGLKRGTLDLHPYDNRWKEEYVSEANRLSSYLEQQILRIAHIGSTSIPGLQAKPILDIAIEVAAFGEIDVVRKILEELGYKYFGDRRSDGDHFFAKGSEEKRTHYLHVSISESSRFDQYIKFRDALRENKELARKYNQLKADFFKKYHNDRESYTKSKSHFIHEVIEL